MQSTRLKIFQAQKNMVANRMTGRSGFNFLAWYLYACVVLFGVMLPATQVLSATIQRTITIDGNMNDWKLPTDITINPGQFSTDAEGDASTGSSADLDFEVQGTGRDLEGFSFTYDATNLYMWVRRYASTNNKTDWWFYIDTDNDGLMESTGGHTDKLLRVAWTGSNGNTTVQLYDYLEAVAGGDSLVCPATGTNSVADGWCPVADVADGYDMPGTVGDEIALSLPDVNDQNGGSTSGTSKGVEMETRISWAALGFSVPSSVGFHISTSNGINIPTQINDNMNGFGGGIGIIEIPPDFIVLKSSQTIEDPVNGSADPKSIPGAIVLYTITITNQGGGATDADTVIITDPVPTNTELFVGDLGSSPAGSPVAFIDGATSSGLSLSFTSLGSTTDDIEFSNVGGAPYAYTPIPDVDGYDTGVTDLRLLLKGTFAASDGTNHPSFRIIFKVRLQ
jgi:uncharacterized repeat protein (TIGR01451 family)